MEDFCVSSWISGFITGCFMGMSDCILGEFLYLYKRKGYGVSC